MKIPNRNSGFALAVTLVLMALILIVIVAYLANTRTERSTSSFYANQLRAKMISNSGLAAATKLLADNTRYGNYITAMPPPVPTPASIYTEVYRPTDSADTTVAKPDDFLQLSNASGEILASRASTATGQVDGRPSPAMILPAGPFILPTPGFSSANSYDFNQIVRLGTSASGRLVNPSATPAYGQWVRVRDSGNNLVGRYAYFIEDESMKVNVNAIGNKLASGNANLRLNDLASPTPTPAPTTQIQELDPAAILPTTANRATADSILMSISAAGSRLSSRSTLALLDQWNSTFADYAHLATVASQDDDTTARGWRRLDLNKIVSDAEAAGTPQAKKAAATRIANWIRDAWTGSTAIGSLQDYQMFGDDWARKQIAANIVDYLDTDSTPTDMGDLAPVGFTAVPVIGLEKTPQLAAIEIIYQASDSTYPGSGAGTFSATIKMKLQFRFLNLFDVALDLSDMMGTTDRSRIELTGVPIVQKNGNPVYDKSLQPFTVKLSSLTPVNGVGTTVSPGIDGQSDSGARTFQTDWLDTTAVSFLVKSTGNQNPKFAAGQIAVKIYGNKTGIAADDYRVDDTSVVTNLVTTGYQYTGSSTGDFLEKSTPSTGPLQIASINYISGYQGAIYSGSTAGDPRYRGRLVSDRWNNNSTRTDATGPGNRIDSFVDKAELSPRSYGFDWFDYGGNRPLGFFRNGPMLNIGELGNVVACEYPWRTVYLQYPERAASTTTAGPKDDIPLRRRTSVDYLLLDLFRTSSVSSRAGAININSQQRVGSTQQHALASLFLGEMVATLPSLTQAMLDRLCTSTGNAGWTTIFDHRGDPNSPLDNTPLHPFFKAGELASVVSRLVNTSVSGSGTTGSPGRSTVTYSFLRNNPILVNESPVNNNIHSDMHVEQEFREISNSITTRGNVFRVLYVGQSIKDLPGPGGILGSVESQSEIAGEYLGEAFLSREGVFVVDSSNSDIVRTTDSSYKILSNRIVTE